jgi:hypothetical protein
MRAECFIYNVEMSKCQDVEMLQGRHTSVTSHKLVTILLYHDCVGLVGTSLQQV